MRDTKNLLNVVAACGLAVVVIVVLAVADGMRFEDAEYSPLYESTLEGAFSRFKENDKRVPAGTPRDSAEIDPGISPSPPAAPVAGQSVAAPAAPAAGAPDMSDLTIGNQYAAQREFDKALAAFRTFLQKNPQSAVGYHRIADVLQMQEQHEPAIAAYRQALALRSSYYCVHGHLGDILLKQGKSAEAEKEFEKLVAGFEAEAKATGPGAMIAKFQLAKFYVDHDRNIEQAIPLAEEAAAASPDQVSYLLPLVTAYQKVGRKQDAVDTIDKITKLKPEFGAYYKTVRDQLLGTGEEKH